MYNLDDEELICLAINSVSPDVKRVTPQNVIYLKTSFIRTCLFIFKIRNESGDFLDKGAVSKIDALLQLFDKMKG